MLMTIANYRFNDIRIGF